MDINHRSSLIQEYLPKEIETILNQKDNQNDEVNFLNLQFIALFIGWGILLYNLPTILDSFFDYIDSFNHLQHREYVKLKPYDIESITKLAESIRRWDAFNQWVIANRLEKGYNKKGLLFLMLKKSTESIIYPKDFVAAMRGNLIF
jgi:hypothetical protein